MILLLDTSTPTCFLYLVEGDEQYTYEWLAQRTLANELLSYIQDCLAKHTKVFSDIEAIGVFQGPGSFTGLRIGLTVCNTIADTQAISIVGTTGEDWKAAALNRIDAGENDRMVLPVYGSEAHITTPRK